MLYQTPNPHGGDIYHREINLDFSANTNPFGTPKGVIDAVQASLTRMHRYPDPYCRRLIQAISEHEQVPGEYILCGNGAAELIYAYCEALRPAYAVELAPTFSEYSLALEREGCRIERFLLYPEQNFELTDNILEFLKNQLSGTAEETSPKAVFLCNPNNPTGRTIRPELLLRIAGYCLANRIHLFVDECFMDLTDRPASLKDLLAENPQIFILKAFTKSYGMAGIRLGYCMTSNTDLLQKMSRTLQPWNVSSLAQAAGIAALKETEFLEESKDCIRREREWLKKELVRPGFQVYPSEANYLLFQVGPELENLHVSLEKEGIAIRNCANYHGLGSGWYRIAVRSHDENQALIEAIRNHAKIQE